MKNKNSVIIIALLIILVVLAVYLAFFKDKTKSIDNQIQYAPTADNNIVGQKNLPETQPQVKAIIWIKSPEFGLYYQNTLNIIEYYMDRYGKEITKSQGAYPIFTATFGKDQDAVITWGGYWGNNGSVCSQNEFGAFQYGVSSVTCLKGFRTWVSHSSARNVVSSEELKTFGDFVLKNQ